MKSNELKSVLKLLDSSKSTSIDGITPKMLKLPADAFPFHKGVHPRATDLYQSKKISNDQELIQSDPISCPQNQKGNN